ncbi:MAG: manganese efflux pump [Chloroflexi bacterium]|nr:manganese efflux pump [Chloroflexota bacterium]
MSLIEILIIAVGLAMDVFAVSLGAATSAHVDSPRAEFRLWWHFGLFQALMPVIGWLMGNTVTGLISPIDHWIAFGLLAFVGARMVRSGFDPDSEGFETNPTRGKTMVMLSIATSIDALAIGLSLALLDVTIWYPSLIIGSVSSTLSFTGLRLGRLLGERLGKRMEIVGGVILILIGLRILMEHSA